MKMIAEFDQDGDFGQLDAGARCAAMPLCQAIGETRFVC